MTSYLKTEIFAYNLFNTVWFKGGLISHKTDADQIYKDECLVESDFEAVCDKCFYNAVLFRRILFQRTYMEEIIKDNDRFWNSIEDFFSYIQVTCKRYDLFGCLNVFERVFATCAFVINLCFFNRENENVDIIKFGYVFWAMYFEEFAEEFYEQGGWNELQRVSSFYSLPILFLQTCLQESENILLEIAAAVQKYNMLKETSIIQECETVSNLWVKSRIKNLSVCSEIPMEFADYENRLHAEYILNELKRLCNPFASEVLQYDEECSERIGFDSDSFYIPLTPTESQESSSSRNSSSSGCSEISNIPVRLGEDVSTSTSASCGGNPSGIDNSGFVNQSSLNEFRDSSYSNSSDESCDCLGILGHPIEFESICLISDCEQDAYLSKCMNSMHLNHETLELEESNISEINLCSNSNENHLLENPDLSTKDLIHVNQKEINNQCQMIEDLSDAIILSMDAVDLSMDAVDLSMDAVDLSTNAVDLSMNAVNVSNDTFTKLSDIESKTHLTKLFNETEFMRETILFNTVASNDNTISIYEWDENDLAKNISTPLKEKNIIKQYKKVESY